MRELTMPIISLEIQGMKHTLLCALSEHGAKMDSDLRAAIEAYCSEGNIAAVVRTEATRILDEAIKEEVRRFFSYTGAGRQAIREAVVQHLNEMYPPIEG